MRSLTTSRRTIGLSVSAALLAVAALAGPAAAAKPDVGCMQAGIKTLQSAKLLDDVARNGITIDAATDVCSDEDLHELFGSPGRRHLRRPEPDSVLPPPGRSPGRRGQRLRLPVVLGPELRIPGRPRVAVGDPRGG